MPKGKILMGKTTPKPGDSDMGLDPNRPRYIGDTKGNMYSVDPKTGKQTLVKAGPKPKPGPKDKPLVIQKQIPNNKRNLPGPVMPPPKGGDPIRRKGNLGDKVKPMQPKPKPVTRRGGR